MLAKPDASLKSLALFKVLLALRDGENRTAEHCEKCTTVVLFDRVGTSPLADSRQALKDMLSAD